MTVESATVSTASIQMLERGEEGEVRNCVGCNCFLSRDATRHVRKHVYDEQGEPDSVRREAGNWFLHVQVVQYPRAGPAATLWHPDISA